MSRSVSPLDPPRRSRSVSMSRSRSRSRSISPMNRSVSRGPSDREDARGVSRYVKFSEVIVSFHANAPTRYVQAQRL